MKSALLLMIVTFPVMAAGPSTITLPKPETTGGKPLMQALAARASSREFSQRKLASQVLSNLLWAAFGINRPDGRRTAPSAMNRQTIDVYAVLPEGVYLYEPKPHRLRQINPTDARARTGTHGFVAEAALDLVYVADFAKMGGEPENDKLLFAGAETGFIGQNVYLFCASEGMATVIRASIDRTTLAKALKLRPDQKITLSQTVGYR
ncbi:MAG TPA: SagB/ThcOx family dehydrogenase [Bryobacteraceae bacterium]|nr:SagB/ThcOx family dehydrogenase [Bryobacteraceae bacterium]